MSINILILSAGTRNKVVQYFRQELAGKGKVFATDCSELAPAIYEADGFDLVPRITDPDYLKILLDICKKREITGVLSLIDPELSLLARHKQEFLDLGVTPIISDYELVETCFNKFAMYEKLRELGIPTGRCFLDRQAFFDAEEAGEMQYPVFVKPVCGSASLQISKLGSRAEVELLCKLQPDLMIQEFMDGTEYGADVYADLLTGKVTSIFIKEKIKMRAGETDKSVSVKDEALFALIRDFTETMGFRGIIDIDIFKVNGTYYISEVNPRFGGGYPHAYACGVNVPAQIIRNLEGKSNEPAIGAYEEQVYMMKYNEIAIIRGASE